MKFDFDWPSGFWEEDFKEFGQWRTMEAHLSYKLTKWAFGSGELKSKKKKKKKNEKKGQ